MRIILDTDTRTIIVPWNYCAKLEEMNKLIMRVTDDPTKKSLSAASRISAGEKRCKTLKRE